MEVIEAAIEPVIAPVLDKTLGMDLFYIISGVGLAASGIIIATIYARNRKKK